MKPDALLKDRWQLHELLGKGAAGEVFRATDLSLGREVAVKIMHPALARSPAFVERFDREARILAALDHPNLVPIYSIEQTAHEHFLVMKLLGGQPLYRRLRSGALSPPEVLRIVRPLCAGLGYIHARGLVHRDLKPGNISIDEDGHVTLLDFGLARTITSRFTPPGEAVGTPHYMSPEQATGADDAIDGRSDLYSLGVIVYEMLTGATPFDDPSTDKVMQAHVDQPPRPPSQLAAVSHRVDAVLLKALAKNPAFRQQSAEEFLEDFERAITPERETGTQEESMAVTDPARPSVQRKRETEMHAVALTERAKHSIDRGAQGPVEGSERPTTPVIRAVARRPQHRASWLILGGLAVLGALLGWYLTQR